MRRAITYGCALIASVCLMGAGDRVDRTERIRHKSIEIPAGWGNAYRPFAAGSPWNSRPAAPVFGTTGIPPAKYAPMVTASGWSTGVFICGAGDQPVTVRGRRGTAGVWNADAHAFLDVAIPRWPADVVPASKDDGHADIVDPISGIVHSFWQLGREHGEWVATQYAWSRLDGSGWGNPAHYFQGARATGVPAMAGLIRKHEVDDGAPMYRHALAMSLATNALSPSPAYVFPATSADKEAANVNSGTIPQGALLMLPPSFATTQIADPRVRKIAETLKTYGAYVVDRNDGTPFVIYAEIGSGLDLHRNGWNGTVAHELDRIRAALRQVVDAGGWIDANGRRYEADMNLNILSMRGPWHVIDGPKSGAFDSWSQAVRFSASKERTILEHDSSTELTPVAWATPRAGVQYRIKADTTGGGKLRIRLNDAGNGKILFDSGELKNRESRSFVWPETKVSITVNAIGGNGKPSTVRADLRHVATAVPNTALNVPSLENTR